MVNTVHAIAERLNVINRAIEETNNAIIENIFTFPLFINEDAKKIGIKSESNCPKVFGTLKEPLTLLNTCDKSKLY